MPTVTVRVVNAFVDNGVGGNPAGVVLEARYLTQENKQAIARKLGMSEIAFVSPSTTADYKLEFFTPAKQIPHCGHATIATFSYLAQLGKLKGEKSSKETIDGNRDIFIRGELAFMEQAPSNYLKLSDSNVALEAVLGAIGLSATDLQPGQEPVVVSNGINGLIIPVQDEATLLRMSPDFAAIENISRELDLVEFYVFSLQTRVAGRDAGTRMFAPYFGVNEESATGMAAGQLGYFLYDFLNIKKNKLVVEQGHLMQPPSPSELLVEVIAEGGRAKKVLVGGKAKVMDNIEVEL
jgi:PhzF family phenazine biosynthesis protein